MAKDVMSLDTEPAPYVDPHSIPASFIQAAARDPADRWDGAPPLYGRPAVPHIFTVVGRYGSQGRAYTNEHDEAIRHSRQNAELMRTECGIMECLEGRQRGTALLNYHIEPEDAKSQEQKDLVTEMKAIIDETPAFVELRRNLLEALWYGRYATAHTYSREMVRGQYRTVIDTWEPRHGDKLMFRYDDNTFRYNPKQLGIRIGAGYQMEPKDQLDYRGYPRSKIEATQYGLAYWFDVYERKTVALHKHLIEDGPWEDPRGAGGIHGVGIRSRIYWTWYAMQECLHNLLTYLERSALGIEIWRYPAHNPKAEEQTRAAAQNRIGNGRTIVLVPVAPGEDADQYGVQHIEPGMGGVEAVKSVIVEYFFHKIKRYILGQTLTSEAEATGLGSGVADAHMATYHDIIRYDARRLEETITKDILRHLQLWNFPASQHIRLKFLIDTEADDAEARLSAHKEAYEMGLRLKAKDLYDIIGTSPPDEDDETLSINDNPMMNAGGMMGGIPGAGMNGGAGIGNNRLPKGAFGNFSQEMGEAGIDLMNQSTRYTLYQDITAAAKEVEVPTDAQSQAGNYRKAHVSIQGLPITIETPRGGYRFGSYGRRKMTHHYGYIKRTEGADNDHVDVFIGPLPECEVVFVIDQVDAGGKFDEHKCMIGWPTMTAAREAYLSNYPDGWRCGGITRMDMATFKSWLERGKQRIPAASQRLQYSAASADSWTDRYKAHSDWTAEDEAKHPRDDSGRWTKLERHDVAFETKGVQKVRPEWRLPGGDALPEFLSHVKLPPAWEDVMIAADPSSHVVARGRDAKGREQRVYSPAHVKLQSDAKFSRVKEGIRKLPDMRKQNGERLSHEDQRVREAAAALQLIMHTGIRPGSDRDTGAEKRAYGATTLEGRHVTQDADGTVVLRFVGKKGVDLVIPVRDESIAGDLLVRKQRAGENGRIFGTNDNQLRTYAKTLDGGGFKTKDFRTIKGTSTAAQMVRDMPRPTTEKERKQQIKQVATKVSEVLGNTPTIALQSYIDPHVFDSWKDSNAS